MHNLGRPKSKRGSIQQAVFISSDIKSMSREEGAGNGVGVLSRMGDPVSDMTEANHEWRIRRIVRRFGSRDSTNEIVDILV